MRDHDEGKRRQLPGKESDVFGFAPVISFGENLLLDLIDGRLRNMSRRLGRLRHGANQPEVIFDRLADAGILNLDSHSFSIARDGKVPKLVIATPSGADTLDRAAVAGISASTPFPPLPAEFKGDRVVLQFNFTYNMPRP